VSAALDGTGLLDLAQAAVQAMLASIVMLLMRGTAVQRSPQFQPVGYGGDVGRADLYVLYVSGPLSSVRCASWKSVVSKPCVIIEPICCILWRAVLLLVSGSSIEGH
jgi:hypothetical protein